MSETANNEGSSSTEADKPAPECDEVKFPPFPDPTDKDFEDDVLEEERTYYKTKFPDLNSVKCMRLHCTACDRHLGSSARNVSRMRAHPMLRTLVCHTCHTFYNSGEFEKGDDGSELYCRWCGQGGQVYCCSDCPHVFCAKCIKRNLGNAKIKEIENADDWKCFKCVPDSLKELRAICWALLRYCDLKNEITYKTEDANLKEIFQKDCSQDDTECCKHKIRKKEKDRSDAQKRKEEKKEEKSTASIVSKIPSTIQVKKFASINIDDSPKSEKKPSSKRSASPKQKPILIKNPVSLAPSQRLMTPILYQPPMKKPKIIGNANTVVRFTNDNKYQPYSLIKPRAIAPLTSPVIANFNGFDNARIFSNLQNMVVNDNINLSLESLTQGLDMATVAAMTTQNNDVVCTPDFPIEPMCEVTEDNDDDVECITPNPVKEPKINNPPPLTPRNNTLPNISSDNIIQMTENDVTVNVATGGLKFRVDPQTLSSNKMYRLPDGRVFAINANPNMPGGYSATIVAVTEPASKVQPQSQGAIYAAKLSAVINPNVSKPVKQRPNRKTRTPTSSKRNTPRRKPLQQDSSSRECDLNVPVEWYRYNLIDAVDALEFSLSRLHKMKKETTSMYLRTRTLGEMRNLHRTLERLLNTSSKRFLEIKDSLNKDMKQFVTRKMGGNITDDDDDDVEILPDLENDDPIFIDENSVDSNANEHDNQEIDLTEANSSELNDSTEKDASISRIETNLSNSDNQNPTTSENCDVDQLINKTNSLVDEPETIDIDEKYILTKLEKNSDIKTDDADKGLTDNESLDNNDINGSNEENLSGEKTAEEHCEGNDINQDNEENIQNQEKNDHFGEENVQDGEEKLQDTEMSDEMIENLLKDDNDTNDTTNLSSLNDFDVQET